MAGGLTADQKFEKRESDLELLYRIQRDAGLMDLVNLFFCNYRVAK